MNRILYFIFVILFFFAEEEELELSIYPRVMWHCTGAFKCNKVPYCQCELCSKETTEHYCSASAVILYACIRHKNVDSTLQTGSDSPRWNEKTHSNASPSLYRYQTLSLMSHTMGLDKSLLPPVVVLLKCIVVNHAALHPVTSWWMTCYISATRYI